MANNKHYKKCLVCGKIYESCPYCDSQNMFYAWRSVVCCEEHMVYHIPIISYIRKIISKEQAQKDLRLAEKTHGKIKYAPEIQSVVDEIMAEDKSTITEDSIIRTFDTDDTIDNAQVNTRKKRNKSNK